MLGIGDEISIFLQALLAGNIVLLVYTCIRVFRRLIKHDLFFVSLEDFSFGCGQVCICLSRSMTLVMVVYVGSLP